MQTSVSRQQLQPLIAAQTAASVGACVLLLLRTDDRLERMGKSDMAAPLLLHPQEGREHNCWKSTRLSTDK